jgi:hypothetical protein
MIIGSVERDPICFDTSVANELKSFSPFGPEPLGLELVAERLTAEGLRPFT